jgi:hypothetical protein
VSVASDVRDRRPALHVANVGFDDLLGGFQFSALCRQIAPRKTQGKNYGGKKSNSTGAHNDGMSRTSLMIADANRTIPKQTE